MIGLVRLVRLLVLVVVAWILNRAPANALVNVRHARISEIYPALKAISTSHQHGAKNFLGRGGPKYRGIESGSTMAANGYLL